MVDLPLGTSPFTDYLTGGALLTASARGTLHSVQAIRFPNDAQRNREIIHSALSVAEIGIIFGHYYALRKYLESAYADGMEGHKPNSESGKTAMNMVGAMISSYAFLFGKGVYQLYSNLPAWEKSLDVIADVGVLSMLISDYAITSQMVVKKIECDKWKRDCPAPDFIRQA